MMEAGVSVRVMTDPNPPVRFGHRNASVAPPNCAANTPSEASRPPRKKSRLDRTVFVLGEGPAGAAPGAPAGTAVTAGFLADRLARASEAPRKRTKSTNRIATTPTANVDEEIPSTVTTRRRALGSTATPSCSRCRERRSRRWSRLPEHEQHGE